MGTALGWATRWNHRTGVRSWGMALGANLGAVCVLASVLLAGAGDMNAVHRPWAWAALAFTGLLWGFFLIRLPRTVGLPVLAVVALAGWWMVGDLAAVSPWQGTALAEVRVVAQSKAVRTVELRLFRGNKRVDENLVDLGPEAWPLAKIELVTLPSWVPLSPLQWWRLPDAPVSTVWRALPSSWVTQLSPVPPDPVAGWVIYQLVPATSQARWVPTVAPLAP